MELDTQIMDLGSEEDQSPKRTNVREKEDIYVGRVLRRYERYKSILSGDIYRPQWIRNYKLWRSYMDKSKYPHRSKLFIPLTFQYIETILPRVASNKITLAVEPRRQADMQYIDSLNQMMAWATNRNKLNRKWPTFARQLIMHGYSVAFAYWNMDPLTGFPFPDFRVIDLFNFYCDPVAFTCIEEAPEAIIRVPTFLGAIRQKAELGVYDKALLEKLEETSSPTEETVNAVTERHNSIGQGADESQSDDAWRQVELLLHITPHKTTVIANRKIVLRESDNNGTMPLVGTPWTEDPFHMMGIGQIEPSQGLQHGVNATENMLFDQRTLSLRPATLVGTANSTVEDSKFQARAGAIIRCNDVGQIRPYVQPDVSGGMNEERMFLMGQMQETHAAMDIVRGASGADETATQAQINNAAIETKLSFPTRQMEEAIGRLGMIWHGLMQKNFTPEHLSAMGYMEDEFPMGMSPESLAASVHLIPVIEPKAPLTKEFKRRSMQEAISGLLGMPGFPELMMENPILQERIYTTVLRHFDMEEGEELIQTIKAAIEQKMQAMMAPPPPQLGGMPGGPQQPQPPGGPPPPQSDQPPHDIGAIINQLSDEELEQLLQAPPEQLSQILFSLDQQQMAGRPQGMPAMMPSVSAEGIM